MKKPPKYLAVGFTIIIAVILISIDQVSAWPYWTSLLIGFAVALLYRKGPHR